MSDKTLFDEQPINICPKCGAKRNNVSIYRDGGTRICDKCHWRWHRCVVHNEEVHVPGQFVHDKCSCGKSKPTGILRALEIRNELFDIANSYVGENTGFAAVTLHEACNKILEAERYLKCLKT